MNYMSAIAIRVFSIANIGQACYGIESESQGFPISALEIMWNHPLRANPKRRPGQSVQMNNMAAKRKKSSGNGLLARSINKADDSLPRWTFLTNHAHVLAILHSDPQLVLRQVAVAVGITERAVQRIVQDLEEGGFVRREKVGRRNRYYVLTNLSLRHPIESHRNIGDLLKLINK
jgi:predicted transcriptional regulator